jgi:hypothetical protein
VSKNPDESELEDYEEYEEEDTQQPPAKRRCHSEEWF